MFEKNLRMTYLLDFYGDVLDGHTKALMEAYYDDDLSLSEIASSEGISRQGVRHVIKRAEEQLNFFEEKLGLAAHHEKLLKYTEKLTSLADKLALLSDEENERLIRELIEEITNKGF